MYEFLGRRRVQTPLLAFRLRRHIAELLGRSVLVGTSHDHLRGDVEGQVRSTTTNSVSLSHAYALRIFLCIFFAFEAPESPHNGKGLSRATYS